MTLWRGARYSTLIELIYENLPLRSLSLSLFTTTYEAFLVINVIRRLRVFGQVKLAG